MANTKVCGCCCGSKNVAQYYKSPIDGTYVAMCKNCVRKKYKQYIEEVGNESAAVWLCLSELGVPYFSDVWTMTEACMANSGPNTDIIMMYLKCLAEDGRVVHGFWESDRMLDQLMATKIEREEVEEFDLKKQQRIWGRFNDDEGKADINAYEFLNRTFEDYTGDLLEMDINLEKRYRDLAKAELRKRRADETGDIGEIAKAQDSLKKILDMLKLSEFKSNVKTDEQLAFESRVSMIEYTKPAECEDLKKYIDMVGYEKDRAQCFRSLRNAICESREYPDIPKEEQ